MFYRILRPKLSLAKTVNKILIKFGMNDTSRITGLPTGAFFRILITPFFLYKNTFYKNIQAEIPEKIRTS